MTAVVTVEEMFSCLYYTLAAMLVVSMLLVVFVPAIGVVQFEWQHVGNWQGVFASKQGLGMISAVFLGIVLLRVVRKRTVFDVAMCCVALACLMGSGSRGAGVIAIVAVACLTIARKHSKLTSVITAVLTIDLLLSVANVAYFVITEEPSILVFGYDINFTERTYIWQYALSLWTDRPLIGFGLNGFWTNSNLYYAYLRLHGWVLDNFHSGYLAILVETGAVGFGLFLTMAFKLIARLRQMMLAMGPQRFNLDMTIVFFIMFFTINLTETYFFRSTNFLSLLFTFLAVKVLSVPSLNPALAPVLLRRLDHKLVHLEPAAAT